MDKNNYKFKFKSKHFLITLKKKKKLNIRLTKIITKLICSYLVILQLIQMIYFIELSISVK